MRNAEPLALVGELVIARILWNRGKHRPHQYRHQDRDETDGVSTGKGSPEVRQRWLDDFFHACVRLGLSEDLMELQVHDGIDQPAHHYFAVAIRGQPKRGNDRDALVCLGMARAAVIVVVSMNRSFVEGKAL